MTATHFQVASAQQASLNLINSESGVDLYELNVLWGDSEPNIGGLLEVSKVLKLESLSLPHVQVVSSEYDEFPYDNIPNIGTEPADVFGLGLSRKKPTATLIARLVTYDSTSSRLRRYRHMRIAVASQNGVQSAKTITVSENPHLNVGRSVLADGNMFKIVIRETGMYRIDRTFLESLTGLQSDVQNIDPHQIRVFGNGGAPVAALNSAPRIADLIQNQVFVQGGGDGSFDEGDAVWFYGKGTSGWVSKILTDSRGRVLTDPQGEPIREWTHYVHPFDSTNYYFLDFGISENDLFEQENFLNLPATDVMSEVQGRYFIDLDEYLWGREGGHSGHTWVSTIIQGPGPGRTIFQDLQLPGLASGVIQYQIRAAIQSNPTAMLHYRDNNRTLFSANFGSLFNSPTSPIARSGISEFSDDVTSGQAINLIADLEDQVGGPQAALDWVRLFYPKSLRAYQQPLQFSTPLAEMGTFTYSLSGFNGAPIILDVTEPGHYRWLGTQPEGNNFLVQVTANSKDQPRELIAFTPDQVQSLNASLACGTLCNVPSQNLHGIQSFPEFVIITPSQFLIQANELADRRSAEGMTVEVVDIAEIYNEFSGGQQDIRGIRDYLKFIYDRSPDEDRLLKYVLLFGDGHYDYRNLDPSATFPNLIPPFQTAESWNPEASYTTDDYYGLLDDNEGLWPFIRGTFRGVDSNLNERVDVGIGRFTVHTIEEAQLMIDKIIHYENPETFGAWRNRYIFLADDGPTGTTGLQNDRDLHTQNTDVVAVSVAELVPEVNQHKIYALSYPRQFLNTWRIPAARQDLLTSIDEGTLVVNFSGHGGERGLTQENLFTVEDSRSLQNYDRLPVFITATCSFGRWDLGNEQTGAEELLLNPAGGAIALLTTVRTVYTSGDATTLNVGLNVALNEELFKREPDHLLPRLGDALRRTKNRRVGYEGNNRKFNLLGDPTLRLGLPADYATITHINGDDLSNAPRRMRALEKIELSGEIRNGNGTVDESFNGHVSLMVFDALRQVPIPREILRYMPQPYYEVREDLIWRGRALVRNGEFSARFVVPKDIAYADQPGKITIYASGEDEHFNGFADKFIVGGTSDDAANDVDGPDIELYLGDETFTSGGLSTSNPEIFARIFDESGINTVGAGIGHEMLLIIDENEMDAINIGNLYETDEGSFQKGSVSYSFDEPLSPGHHSLSLRAWDVLNNSGESTVDFVVTDTEELVIRNVFNYPNPTTGPTRFVFEHNQVPGTPVKVLVRVYTLAGRPIKNLEAEDLLPAGPMQIPWDGLDNDYARLSPGVYLYKLRAETMGAEAIHVAEVIEKLAIIR
ncbi:MAG: type IX secretion system sortase PorU [Bacteroidetes bacterium]|nr:type IX secretion system sortase PorU [Bacteroidota bacterium]